MPKARAVNPRDILPVVALDLIAKGGWAALTIEGVAKTAKMAVADVKAVAADKQALLGLIVEWVDGQAGQTFGLGPEVPDSNGTGSPAFAEDLSFRDQVFEALMARIDVMQERRAGFTRLIKDVRVDPCGVVTVMPGVFTAMNRVTGGDFIKSIGITAVYAATLRVWLNDESEDLSATMAELDKRLSQAERLAGFLKLQS